MQTQTDNSQTGDRFAASTFMALFVLTGSMLLAMFTRTGPRPPLEVDPLAFEPFLAASLVIGSAACVFALRGAPYAKFGRADYQTAASQRDAL